MKQAIYSSRTADKFVVRLPDGMRERIADVARNHHRSMNSEIIARLEQSMLQEGALDQCVAPRFAAQVGLDFRGFVHGRHFAAAQGAHRLRGAPACSHGQEGGQRDFEGRLHDGDLHV